VNQAPRTMSGNVIDPDSLAVQLVGYTSLGRHRRQCGR
jgi:hypothetical protein